MKDQNRVNEDFIPVVNKNGAMLKYVEISIEKKYEYLISLIRKALKDDSKLLIEVQNTFSYIFTGKPNGYSFCFPHDYSEAFVKLADYPKIYSQEEYDSEINQVRIDYINKETEKLNREKEDGIIDDNLYQESLKEIKDKAEKEVNNRIEIIRNSFVNESIRYIQAFEFYTSLNKIKEDEANVMYSTEIIGWTKFNYSINNNVSVNFKSNFCYGRSAYFHITLIYKGVVILSYPKLVQYYYADMMDFIDCTESFKPDRQNWKPALTFVVEQGNWANADEDAFVQKWIIDGTKELVFGLNNILHSPNSVIDELIGSKPDDSSLYAVRNITNDEIAEYKIYRHEVTVAFQAEKISGALLLIPNLEKLCSLYSEIKSIIGKIECINSEFFPQLHNAIVSLSDKINTLSEKIESLQITFRVFRSHNYRILRDFEVFESRNRNGINAFGEYVKQHPEFKGIYKKNNEYKEEIEALQNEHKRLSSFKAQLSRCAQMIVDYGLADTYSEDYLSTSVTLRQNLLFVVEKKFKMSKDKRRLFKYLEGLSSNKVIIPDTIKVICDNSVTGIQGQELKLPLGVKKIGYSNFQRCNNLKEVRIPDTVVEMGTDAFYNCKSLQKVYLSNSLQKISRFSFNECTSLDNIVIPDSVKIIERGSFMNCTSLRVVTLPNSIELIEDRAFSGCKSLRTIRIPFGTTDKFKRMLPEFKGKFVELRKTYN